MQWVRRCRNSGPPVDRRRGRPARPGSSGCAAAVARLVDRLRGNRCATRVGTPWRARSLVPGERRATPGCGRRRTPAPWQAAAGPTGRPAYYRSNLKWHNWQADRGLCPAVEWPRLSRSAGPRLLWQTATVQRSCEWAPPSGDPTPQPHPRPCGLFRVAQFCLTGNWTLGANGRIGIARSSASRNKVAVMSFIDTGGFVGTARTGSVPAGDESPAARVCYRVHSAAPGPLGSDLCIPAALR